MQNETGCAGSFERGKTDSDVLLRGSFFKRRLRWAFHGRATPDFEPGRGLALSAHYQPGTLNALINHPSGCSRVCCRDCSPTSHAARNTPARLRASRRKRLVREMCLHARNSASARSSSFTARFCCGRRCQVTGAKDRPAAARIVFGRFV